jgi:hypothetical protein
VKAKRVVRRRGSRIFYTVGSQMSVRLSALSAGRPLLPRKIPVTHSVSVWVDHRAIVRLERLGRLKSSNDLIENRTRDLPACIILPQPNTLPRSPFYNTYRTHLTILYRINRVIFGEDIAL